MKPKQAMKADCANCPLFDWANALVPSTKGIDSPDLIVVADFPGQHEAFVKQPFTGQHLALLNQVLSFAGVDTAKVYFTNAALCHPKYIKDNDDKLTQALAACSERLRFTLEQFGPDVPVLALGKWAAHALGVQQFRWQQEGLTGKWTIATYSLPEIMAQPDKFYQWRRSLQKLAKGVQPVQPFPDPVWVDVPDELPEITAFEKFPVIAVDIETATLDRNEGGARVLQVGIGVSREADTDPRVCGVTTYILTEWVLATPRGREWMQQFIEAYQDRIGGHNYKFDTLFQSQVLGTVRSIAWDTMLMANVLHGAWFKSLKDLATFYFDADDYELVLKNWLKKNYRLKAEQHYGNVPEQMLGEYLNLDLHYTLQLYYELRDELQAVGRWERPYLSYEVPLTNALAEVEFGGFRVDMTKHAWASQEMGASVDALRAEVVRLSGGQIENPNSPQQVAAYIWDTLKIPFPRMAGYTYPTTANPVLVEIEEAHPVVRAIIKFRRVSKLKSSYVDNLPQFIHRGCVYPSYKQAHVKTGRLSAADPAIQTIPRKDKKKDGDSNYGQVIKTLYVPDPGHVLVAVDGSQWELRVAAGWSQDPYLLKAYRDGVDFHGAMCDLLYGPGWNSAMRADEKRIMFGLLYGGSLESLVSVAELTEEQKMRVLNVFYTELTRLIAWRDEMFEEAKAQGCIVAPYFNRSFDFDLVTKGNARDVQKYSVNWPVQGTASMITAEALTHALPRLTKLDARIVATVHDSIIASCLPEVAAQVAQIIAEELEAAGSRAFPNLPWVAEAEVGPAWGEMTEFDYKTEVANATTV